MNKIYDALWNDILGIVKNKFKPIHSLYGGLIFKH